MSSYAVHVVQQRCCMQLISVMAGSCFACMVTCWCRESSWQRLECTEHRSMQLLMPCVTKLPRLLFLAVAIIAEHAEQSRSLLSRSLLLSLVNCRILQNRHEWRVAYMWHFAIHYLQNRLAYTCFTA